MYLWAANLLTNFKMARSQKFQRHKSHQSAFVRPNNYKVLKKFYIFFVSAIYFFAPF